MISGFQQGGPWIDRSVFKSSLAPRVRAVLQLTVYFSYVGFLDYWGTSHRRGLVSNTQLDTLQR
jgi:hypothetical protein